LPVPVSGRSAKQQMQHELFQFVHTKLPNTVSHTVPDSLPRPLRYFPVRHKMLRFVPNAQ
jgi:hypothetical protein